MGRRAYLRCDGIAVQLDFNLLCRSFRAVAEGLATRLDPKNRMAFGGNRSTLFSLLTSPA
jgi:hypothetical protein